MKYDPLLSHVTIAIYYRDTFLHLFILHRYCDDRILAAGDDTPDTSSPTELRANLP